MNWTTHIRSEFARLGKPADDSVVEELAQHAATAWEAARADGAASSDADARVHGLVAAWCEGTSGPRRTRRAPLVEVAPPARGSFLFGGVMGDLRHAVRELRATPGFTIVALVVLTLGIGATTAIFSVVDAVVLRGLPFDEHDRLVAIGERGVPGNKAKRAGPLGPPALTQVIRWLFRASSHRTTSTGSRSNRCSSPSLPSPPAKAPFASPEPSPKISWCTG